MKLDLNKQFSQIVSSIPLCVCVCVDQATLNTASHLSVMAVYQHTENDMMKYYIIIPQKSFTLPNVYCNILLYLGLIIVNWIKCQYDTE